MPPNIPTIRDAQQALETLQRFLDTMSTMFGQVADVHQSNAQSQSSGTAALALLAKRSYKPKTGKMTWKQRVKSILEDSSRPLTPKSIADEFSKRYGWNDKRSLLGNRVRSTLALMKRDGDVATNETGKYRLITQEDILK